MRTSDAQPFIAADGFVARRIQTLCVMKRMLSFCVAALLFAPTLHSAASDASVAAAATRVAPNVKWHTASAIVGDFTCQRRKQHAILGIGEKSIHVAVFTRGLKFKPTVLEFALGHRGRTGLRIKAESLDFQPGSTTGDGDIPEGMKPSKTCKGIELGDGETDSTHIYWNRVQRQFEAFSQ